MIVNEREYRITRAAVRRFEEALAHVEDRAAERHPLAQKAMREQIESQIEELREQLAQYEALRRSPVPIRDFDAISRIPDTLIQGRIAAGLTQEDLARRLGLRKQQIQRYEQTEYRTASLARIQAVVEAIRQSAADLTLTHSTAQAPSTRTPSRRQAVRRRQSLRASG